MYLIEKMHMQSVQNCLFSTLNMEICDVLGALAVMVTSAPYNHFLIGLHGDLKVSCWKLKQKTKTAVSNRR